MPDRTVSASPAAVVAGLVIGREFTAYCSYLVGVPNWAETVNSGSVEPDQARTCEGKQELRSGIVLH